MEADDITQHCFRCKGLAVVDKRYWESLPGLLYRAAAAIKEQDKVGVNEEIVQSLKTYAIFLDMMPDD